MNATNLKVFCVVALLAAAGGAFLLKSRSGSSSQGSTPVAATELRGQPINSTPVAESQPAVAVNPTPAPTVPAVPTPVAATPAPIPEPAVAASTTLSTAKEPVAQPIVPVTPPLVAAASNQTVAAETPKAKIEAAVTALADAAPATTKEANSGDEFATVGFDKLASFNYVIPDDLSETNKTAKVEKQPDQIPATVRAFDQKRIALKGFMLPLKVQGGLVTELLVMRDQSMCCYGTVPKINEWVSVKMVNKGIKPVMDQAVTLYGKLHVGEVRENGYLVGIYQLDGEKMGTPAGL